MNTRSFKDYRKVPASDSTTTVEGVPGNIPKSTVREWKRKGIVDQNGILIIPDDDPELPSSSSSSGSESSDSSEDDSDSEKTSNSENSMSTDSSSDESSDEGFHILLNKFLMLTI